MDATMKPAPPPANVSAHRLFRRVLPRFLLGFGFWGALFFIAAGTLAWPQGWLCLLLDIFLVVVNFLVLRRYNPGILAVRMRQPKPTRGFDRIILPPFRILAMTPPLIAGLDAVRFHWSAMSPWWIVPGILLHLAGDALITWTMLINPFLEQTVRIQSEFGHHVITGGPYRFVRHPMYLGAILMCIGMPLVLGSWWTFAPTGICSLALLVRIVFEDAMLRNELPGYADYARQTRWRILPGVW